MPRIYFMGDTAGGRDSGITHIILYGQSLSLGSDPINNGSVISSSNASHKRFNGGVRAHYDTPGISNVNSPIDPDQIASLATLSEQLSPSQGAQFGETYASGIALKQSGTSLFSATGRGAYRIDQLSRQTTVQTDNWHFANTHATVIAGKELADAASLTYNVPKVVWKQGEADGAAGTTKSSYKTQLTALVNDLRATIKAAAYVDTSSMVFVADQLAFQNTGNTSAELAVGVLELHRLGDGKVICAGPTYAEEFAANNDVHMTSNGYRNYGERLGRVLSVGSSWNPCHITAVSRTGTSITLTVYVPRAPLVKDTTLVSSVANDGFTYTGANITGVSITNDGTGGNTATILITIDADAGGTLRYAYNNGTNLFIGPVSGMRGNIRDSEPASTVNDATPLYNWLCVDEWVVA